VAGCCECGDEPSGSCATVLVFIREHLVPSCNKTYVNINIVKYYHN
jgi:hypothetical protein